MDSTASLSIIDGNNTIDYVVILKKYKNVDFTKLLFSAEGKICFLDIHRSFRDDCLSKQSIDDKWIIVVSNKQHLTNNISIFTIGNPAVQAILVLEGTFNSYYAISDYINAYFEVTAKDYLSLKQYDWEFRKGKTDVYARIKFQGSAAIYEGKEGLLFIMIIIIAISAVLLAVWSWYVFWLRKNYFTQLQRYYTPLPFMLFIICGGVYYAVQSKVYSESKEITSLLFMLLTEILIKLIKIIFKTFFWILLILISYVRDLSCNNLFNIIYI